jgi:prophage antirepressor-like protein
MKDGTEYFVAKDLAPILGYRHAREAVRTRVDKRDRITVRNPDATSAGGNPSVLAVNESGLWALVLGSRKPEARTFKYWVTNEVLPTLRKTGHYEIGSRIPALLSQIAEQLRGRGVAKARQLNRVVAHHDGTFSVRVGKRWTRRIPTLDVGGIPQSHALREGLALAALRNARMTELVQ